MEPKLETNICPSEAFFVASRDQRWKPTLRHHHTLTCGITFRHLEVASRELLYLYAIVQLPHRGPCYRISLILTVSTPEKYYLPRLSPLEALTFHTGLEPHCVLIQLPSSYFPFWKCLKCNISWMISLIVPGSTSSEGSQTLSPLLNFELPSSYKIKALYETRFLHNWQGTPCTVYLALKKKKLH